MLYFKRLLGWSAFLAGLMVLLSAMSGVVVPKDNTTAAGMEQIRANGILGEPAGTIDLLVLGDSEAHTSFSPPLLWKQTGYTSYTCGTDSQKLTYSKTMLERALQRQRPKVVMLEALAVYRNITLKDTALEELSRHFPVFRYHNRWKSLSPQDFAPAASAATSRNPYKGHRPNRAVNPYEQGAYMFPTEEVEKIPVVNRLYVHAIQALCAENGARLLLFSAPSPVNWSWSRHNGIQALAAELGCDYLDLNLPEADPGIDWSQDTYDQGDHLNHTGAAKVTAALGGYLQDTGLFTDHRPDATYSPWVQALEEYERLLQQI